MSQGGTKQARLDKLTKQIEEEQEIWAEKNMETGRLNLDTFAMNCKLQACVRLIQTHFDLEDADLDIVFKEEILKEMQAVRSWLEPQIAEAKREFEKAQLEASLGIRNGIPGIVDAYGNPIRPKDN